VIGLDTNVLLRFIVQDDPEQGERVGNYVARLRDAGEVMYVTDVVLLMGADNCGFLK